MAKKYSDLKAPKEENMDAEFEKEMMDDLDLEEGEMDESGSDLSMLSDDELMAEMKLRGLMDSEEDMDLEDDMDEDLDI